MKYKEVYITLLRRLLLLMFIYFLCRLGFFLFNYAGQGFSFISIINAFLKGMIFDLNAILYINLPFIFLSLLPFRFIFSKGYQMFLKIFFFVSNSIPVYFNIADFEYARFTGKRTDSSVFGIRGDITEQFGQMVIDFWYLLLTGILLSFLLWWLYPRQSERKKEYRPFHAIILFVVFLAGLLMGLRGSFGVKPLKPFSAYSKNSEMPDLVLNTPFCMIHTLDKKPLERLDYYAEDELTRLLPQPLTNKKAGEAGENVVIFILESFSPEFVGFMNNGKGCTPFLDSIANEGLSFSNCFSNGRTSQVAVPSILAGLPQLMDESIITSPYQTNYFFSLPQFLKSYGYHSFFFHGGKNGTMGFDSFANKMGYSYYGADEYPDKKEFDGSWGIYDGPYLKYCARMLSETKKPFVAAIFTLSSHQPYRIPDEEKKNYSYGNEIMNSVAYTDHALKGFFEAASGEEWVNHTLFVFVADHSHPPVKKKNTYQIDGFRIPLVLYYPGGKLKADTAAPVQQVDILPTLVDFLGLQTDDLPRFGSSVFFAPENKSVFFYGKQSYFLVNRSWYCRMMNNEVSFYRFGDIPFDTTANTFEEKRLKAIQQYFNNSMITNSFVRHRK